MIIKVEINLGEETMPEITRKIKRHIFDLVLYENDGCVYSSSEELGMRPDAFRSAIQRVGLKSSDYLELKYEDATKLTKPKIEKALKAMSRPDAAKHFNVSYYSLNKRIAELWGDKNDVRPTKKK